MGVGVSVGVTVGVGVGVAVAVVVGVGVGVPEVTVSIALLLVTLPAILPTTTAKSEPLSAAVVGGVVYDALVAPGMLTPFFIQ